jgi:hypothetical protein
VAGRVPGLSPRRFEAHQPSIELRDVGLKLCSDDTSNRLPRVGIVVTAIIARQAARVFAVRRRNLKTTTTVSSFTFVSRARAKAIRSPSD